MAVLMRGLALARDICQDSQALTTASCGIGPSPTPGQRNTYTFEVQSTLTALTCAKIGPRCM
eukprot:412925-Prorocentrum_lima.AAC.1